MLGDIPAPRADLLPPHLPPQMLNFRSTTALQYVIFYKTLKREKQKDSDNHWGARETESIRLELKLLKSNWSVGENEQREELNIFTKELMNRLKVFM